MGRRLFTPDTITNTIRYAREIMEWFASVSLWAWALLVVAIIVVVVAIVMYMRRRQSV